jgi:PAS domain S-box-containing protein
MATSRNEKTPLRPAPSPSKLEQLEREEGALWRVALSLLVVLAAGFAVMSWNLMGDLPKSFKALPIGLVLLVVFFGIHAWLKSRQIAELRGLVRGLAHRASVPPNEKQLDQLFAMVAQSQQGYRDLIDTFDDLLFALSIDGEIRAANRSVARLLGRPFNEFIGHRLDEFVEDPQGPLRAVREKALPEFLERRQWSGIIRVRLKTKDSSPGSSLRFFDCVLHALNRDGPVTGLSGIARDVTQQRESEARFTELFETLQEGVYITTPEGRLLDANPALVGMLGYNNKEELLRVRVDDLYVDSAQRSIALGELERQGMLQGREILLRRKDGSRAICLDTSTAIRDSFGHVLRYQGTLLDITHRREMEKRLHKEQEFARRLVDSFPDLIVVLNAQGHYTWVSPRITETLGYAPEELIGQALGDRAHPEDRPMLLELYRDLVAGKRTYANVEYRGQNKQKEWRLLRASASPLFDEAGKIVGVIASARDVTELKRLEQHVTQSEKLAAMGQMIAGVAHELNNPLTAILGVSELLRERAADEGTQRQLELAHRQARRAANIVQSLLAFSRPAVPKRAPLNLNEVIQRTLHLHDYSLRKNQIEVNFVPAANLPLVIGDASQMIQVFLNLITNAEQAIREVRERGTLRVRLSCSGSTVEAAFHDDGPGIPPDALPRIFDPFFTTKRPGRGTGLGLSISMAILREHGGNLEAQSTPGCGSVFTVSLPIAGTEHVVPTPPAPGASGARMTTQTAPSLQGRSILVVDDEESILELVQDGLSARGLTVDCAATGEQALSLVAQRHYDAVLCDLHLTGSHSGGLSGLEVFGRLSEGAGNPREGPKPFLIVMTGDLLDAATLEALSQTGSRVMQKPFRISDLLAILSEALDNPIYAGKETAP